MIAWTRSIDRQTILHKEWLYETTSPTRRQTTTQFVWCKVSYIDISIEFSPQQNFWILRQVWTCKHIIVWIPTIEVTNSTRIHYVVILSWQWYSITHLLSCINRLIKEEINLIILINSEVLVPLLILTWPVSITWYTTCSSVILLEGCFIECHSWFHS